MQLVHAIVRPEKVDHVVKGLEENGYFAFSRWQVLGRGKQKGIQVGEVVYSEMPKSMLYLVVEDDEKNEVIDIIMDYARSSEEGNSGDGRIFVNPIAEAYTISEQQKDN